MADDIPIRIHGYKLGKTVGVGAFGKVKHAVHEKTGVEVAIKILNRRKIHTQDMEEKVRREIANLRRCRHPHVIALYEVISCPTDIFVVMEYVPNGELFEHIVQKGRLGASEAREVFQQILAGVAYFHARGIVHRDLKPENLLLDSDYNIKIADFGLSNVMMDGYFLRTSCGSPNYAAPEVISGELYAGPEVDVWSLGVILFALLCGSLPFDDENIPNLFKKIRSGRFKTPGLLGKEATDLVKKILKVPPMERLTLDQIRNHEWVLQDLPKYLAHEFLRTEQEFDREIAAKVKDMGYPDCTTVADVQAAVDSDEASPVQVAYNLLLDVKRRAQRSEDLAAARAKRMARSESGGSLLSSVEESAGLAPLSFGRRDATGVVMSRSLSSMSMFGSGTLSVGPGAGAGPRTPTTDDTVMTRKRPKRRRWRRWYLGIQSKKAPSKVMSEVFRALSEGGFEWKQRGPYRIRCRCLDESTGKYIKIGLQLYRVQRGIYLLDLQKISGDGFTFMNLCSQIIMELKVPSSSLTVTKVVPGDTGLVGHAVRSIRSESVGSGHSLSPTMYPSTPPSAPLPMPIKGRGPRAPQPPQ